MKQKLISYFVAGVISLIFISCGGKTELTNDEDYLVTISTPMGDMKAILYDETPLHKKNFIDLAQAGKYDNTIWHRVIEGFMIQGGDIYRGTDEQEPADGKIPAEIVPGMFHTRGSLAAARQGDQANPERKSSNCQFYVVQGQPYEELTTDLNTLNNKMSEMLGMPKYAELREKFEELAAARDIKGMNKLAFENRALCEAEFGIDLYLPLSPEADKAYKGTGGTPMLDEAYTVFGKVVEGLEVIDKIAAVKTNGPPRDQPLDEITMKVSVDKVAKTEITEKYGYQYK